MKRGRRMREKLPLLGRAVWATGAARFYHDGDGAGFIWRWWHPVAWVLAPLLFLIACVLQGVPETVRERHEIGFGMNPWFKAHPERLEFE